MWGDEEDDDQVCINAGGMYFWTMRATLNKSPYLKRLSPKGKAPNGNYMFLDRDPSAFLYVLNYLRNGIVHLGNEDCGFLELLKHEAKVYELPEMLAQVAAHKSWDLSAEVRKLRALLKTF